MTFAFTLVFTQDLTVQLIDECGSLQTVMNVRYQTPTKEALNNGGTLNAENTT